MKDDIIEKIKSDTRTLLIAFNKPNLAKILKFYEILIDMQLNQITKNKREIFYQSVPIFKKQATIDTLIKRMYSKFNLTTENLLITSSLKGLYFGPVTFITSNQVLVNTLLIPDMTRVCRIEVKSNIVVVIEKDSFFSFVRQVIEKNKRLNEIIWVCGKGYPCQNTLRFLYVLKESCNIYGIFDYDPYGIHIFNVYKHGSIHNKKYIVENIVRIGICASDVLIYKIDEKDLIDLNQMDYKMIERLLKYDEIREDLMFLKGLKRKMEIEIFVGRGKDFMEHYLLNKLKLLDF